ncbi:hypothetical protein ACO2Q1_03525 [Brevundimonas sp. VNH65]|uniref:hypothetical protein n=1 Tax=Brevundimonas sp. VNH65 TaxID=3400917 RepID=UPI003BFF6D26
MLRPALALVLGSLVTSCSGVEGDADRFEAMARQVAAIPVDGAERPATSAELGLRPALSTDRPVTVSTVGLKVEVMDPHELWDARDGLRRPFAPTREKVKIEVRPQHATAVATPPAATQPATGTATTIQLGAYSSLEIARAAWTDARAASAALRGLTPEFATVQVNGKPFVRLRVKAPVAEKGAICRALEISDPWCLRGV